MQRLENGRLVNPLIFFAFGKFKELLISCLVKKPFRNWEALIGNHLNFVPSSGNLKMEMNSLLISLDSIFA